jgi:hypothetical protein
MLEQTAVYQRARTQVQKKGIKEQGKKGGTSSAIGSLQPCERSELPHAAAYPLPTTKREARLLSKGAKRLCVYTTTLSRSSNKLTSTGARPSHSPSASSSAAPANGVTVTVRTWAIVTSFTRSILPA